MAHRDGIIDNPRQENRRTLRGFRSMSKAVIISIRSVTELPHL